MFEITLFQSTSLDESMENKYVSSKQWTTTLISNPALVCANINQNNN